MNSDVFTHEETDFVERRPSLMHPLLENLTDRVDSKFTLVSLAAKRARQINSYFNQLGEGLGTIVPPQVTSLSRKPLSISLEEIEAGKIVFERPEVVEKSIK
jgi:DNA-directed RNA polymerase subunit omega